MPPGPLDTIHCPVENFEKYCISQEEAALEMGPMVLNAMFLGSLDSSLGNDICLDSVFRNLLRKVNLRIFTEHLPLASVLKEHLIGKSVKRGIGSMVMVDDNRPLLDFIVIQLVNCGCSKNGTL